MKNRSFSIDVAMITRKFYCHKCGARLERSPHTRTVRRGDPDYREHSRIGRLHVTGDIEVTEYNFRCPACDRVVDCDGQYVIERIQRSLGKRKLSEEEIAKHEASARAALDRKKRILGAIVMVVSGILVAVALYFSIAS